MVQKAVLGSAWSSLLTGFVFAGTTCCLEGSIFNGWSDTVEVDI